MDWLSHNAAALGILVALVGLLWPVYQYVQTRRDEQASLEFERYHRSRNSSVPTPRTARRGLIGKSPRCSSSGTSPDISR